MGILRTIAILFGIVFIVVGAAGFVPSLVKDGNLLLGIFEIDTMHNCIHIISGVIALIASMNAAYARLYFKIFGIIYGLVAIIGIVNHGDVLTMHMNTADHILHVVIAVVSLYLGFVFAGV